MLKTLAAKHSSTVTKIARKYKTRVATDDGPRICFQVTVPRDGREPLVSRFGGIPLKRQPTAIISDRKPPRATTQGNELSAGSSPDGASSARHARDCKSTTCGNSPISTSLDGPDDRRGSA